MYGKDGLKLALKHTLDLTGVTGIPFSSLSWLLTPPYHASRPLLRLSTKAEDSPFVLYNLFVNLRKF